MSLDEKKVNKDIQESTTDSPVAKPESTTDKPKFENRFNSNGRPGGDRPFNPNFQRDNNRDRGQNRKFDRKPRERVEELFEEKVVTINRVTKVTKGGRHFRFAAVVVVGDKKGRVGFGTGKANEVPDAIKKAIKEAKKAVIKVSLHKSTVPHEVLGHYGSGKVLIKPAKEGTGVIAGGPSRAVIELAGVSDVYAKSLGSNTPINMIRATIEGLKQMRTKNQIIRLRENQPLIKKDKEVAKVPTKE